MQPEQLSQIGERLGTQDKQLIASIALWLNPDTDINTLMEELQVPAQKREDLQMQLILASPKTYDLKQDLETVPHHRRFTSWGLAYDGASKEV